LPVAPGAPQARGLRFPFAGWRRTALNQRPRTIPCRVAQELPPVPGGAESARRQEPGVAPELVTRIGLFAGGSGGFPPSPVARGFPFAGYRSRW
jgi:hypothetical protein